MISRELVKRYRLSPLKGYQIAQLAGLHPSTLSKLINGIQHPKPRDQRIVAVGRILGLSPEECFREDALKAGAA